MASTSSDDVKVDISSDSASDDMGSDVDTTAEDEDNDSDSEGSVAPHIGRKVVLVTGCAGFIGSNCAARLIERGDIVIGVDEVNDYYDTRIKRANLERLETLSRDAGKNTL